ncbi:hypothetical protein WDU94_006197, partial [Cyamophila willieti]
YCPLLRNECSKDADCSSGLVCSADPLSGLRKCVNLCANTACGVNELCTVDPATGSPACDCKPGFSWNALTSGCELPSLPQCSSNKDCQEHLQCRPDALGVLQCANPCDEFQCPANSTCSSVNHQGTCSCLPGYTGNPELRAGCQPIPLNTCTSDQQCAETQRCSTDASSGIQTCENSCDRIKCGKNSVCVVNNHEPRCVCPPGSYVGDPHVECRQVPCVYNHDCPSSQACDLLSHTCISACDEDPCHPTARCEDTGASGKDGVVCSCPELSVGDPYKTGCVPQGQCPHGDTDCPPNSRCTGGHCVSLCSGACGPNALCKTVDRRPVCYCPTGYSSVGGEARVGCFRQITTCAGDFECVGNDRCIGGKCQVACLSTSDCSQGERCIGSLCQSPCSSHAQCPAGLACVGGTCGLGCRASDECATNMICMDNKCTGNFILFIHCSNIISFKGFENSLVSY